MKFKKVLFLSLFFILSFTSLVFASDYPEFPSDVYSFNGYIFAKGYDGFDYFIYDLYNVEHSEGNNYIVGRNSSSDSFYGHFRRAYGYSSASNKWGPISLGNTINFDDFIYSSHNIVDKDTGDVFFSLPGHPATELPGILLPQIMTLVGFGILLISLMLSPTLLKKLFSFF